MDSKFLKKQPGQTRSSEDMCHLSIKHIGKQTDTRPECLQTNQRETGCYRMCSDNDPSARKYAYRRERKFYVCMSEDPGTFKGGQSEAWYHRRS